MTKDHFKEPLPPGVKNLDNYEIDFPEHNLEDYVCYSNKGAKQPDTNYEKDIKVDDVFIQADKHDQQEEIPEQDNDMDQYFVEQQHDLVDEDDDDYDPTPQYLWDDTGGEPPISAAERNKESWEEKQRLKGRR